MKKSLSSTFWRLFDKFLSLTCCTMIWILFVQVDEAVIFLSFFTYYVNRHSILYGDFRRKRKGRCIKMSSYLSVENLTAHPAITVCGVDGVIFSDIPRGTATPLKTVDSGSLRLELYDNFMKPITVMWLPMKNSISARLTVHPHSAEFTLLP